MEKIIFFYIMVLTKLLSCNPYEILPQKASDEISQSIVRVLDQAVYIFIFK